MHVSLPVCDSTSENLALVIRVWFGGLFVFGFGFLFLSLFLFTNSSFALTLAYMLPLSLLKWNCYLASVGTHTFLICLSDTVIVRQQM